MSTTHASAALAVGIVSQARPSQLRSVARPKPINAVALRLQQALAEMEDLKRGLAASRQESLAARQEIEILRKANAQLAELTRRREHALVRGVPQSSTWKRTNFCLSAGLDPGATPHIERLLTKPLRFRDGDVLFRVGDAFKALYAIRTGSSKTVLLAKGGQDQVAGYHMAGEVIGVDGIGTDIHQCQAIALEDMEVYRLPFDEIENLARLSNQFRRNLHKLLSQECARAQSLMLVLGTMRAEKRLAVFLLDLSLRYKARGYSSCEFVLRMTREEIGSYLGLKLETVSRLFSRFQLEGLLQVQGRTVKLLDVVALNQLVAGSI